MNREAQNARSHVLAASLILVVWAATSFDSVFIPSAGAAEANRNDQSATAPHADRADPPDQLNWLTQHERQLVADVELAQQMLRAYRQIDTYKAFWRYFDKGLILDSGYEFVTVFDRDSQQALFFWRELMENPANAPNAMDTVVGRVIAHDGERLIRVDQLGRRTKERAADPLTYERFDTFAMSPWTSWDLALLFSDTPLTDVLGGPPNSVKRLQPDAGGRPGLQIKRDTDYVILTLNPESKLVEAKKYVNTTEYDADEAKVIEREDLTVNKGLGKHPFDPAPYIDKLKSDAAGNE
jgi:hypothetical protein